MKKILFLILAVSTFQFTAAQDISKQSKDSIYEYIDVEVKPDFKGGTEGFYKFIAKNFKAPEQEGLNGKIIAAFIIEKDGSINDIKVLQDVGFGSADEITKVLLISPKWVPAKINDIPVRVRFQLPITIHSAEKYSRKIK